MKNGFTKFLVSILTAAMILTSLPVNLLTVKATENKTSSAVADSVSDADTGRVDDGELQEEILQQYISEGEEAEITRAQWLSMLADTFEMTVEDDYYPDNYFSDLDSSSEYYYDVLLNVEFGVVDVETGGEIRPDDAATREFAAHTLNFCLGYQMDQATAAVCSDIDDSPYKEDLYIAVNRGWFETVDGEFLPEQGITQAEADFMLADAEEILQSMEVDSDADNTYELAEDVIVLSKECDSITVDDEGLYTILVTDLQQDIATGNRFAIYQDTMPTVLVAESVSVNGSVTTITATVDESDDAFTDVSSEGIVYGSVANVEALDGAELVFVDEETEEEFESAEEIIALYGATTKKLTNSTVVVKKNVKLGEGLSGQIELKLKNAKVTYEVKASKLSAYAYLECDTELTFSCNVDLESFSPINDVRLVNWTVPGVGGFVVEADLDLQAAATGVQKGYLKTGIDISKKNGVRLINGFKAKSFSLVAQAQADLSLEARLGITELPILKAYGYARIGGTAEATRTEWTDSSLPRICVDFNAYLYARFGFYGELKFLGFESKFSIDKPIIDESNSPIRCVKHYDDGIEVSECARDAVTEEGGEEGTAPKKKRYVTPANSSWSGSYWGSGTQSAGKDESGTPIPMYDYDVNSDGETATITGYNGSSTSLVIPGTLDGYKVTRIDSFVFENNSKICSVSIPDSVTFIGRNAFNNCTKLESVKMSNNLETMERYAFGNCDLLKSITIPKSLTVGGTDYGFDETRGAFAGCSGLKNIVFEEGTTEIATCLFKDCDGLKNITIPDSVTKIESDAFQNCINLTEINFSKNLKNIDCYAFAGCTELQEVDLSNSIRFIERNAFDNCKKLADVKLSKNLEEMERYAFGNCDALESITIPKSLTIGGTDYGFDETRGAFAGSSGLKNIVFEEGTTEIATCLFKDCDGLENITIPDSVTKIESDAFQNCINLTEINFSKNLKNIDGYAFAGCTELQEVDLPNGVTIIGRNAFENCSKLECVRLSEKLERLERYAFGNCDALESITIPRSLTIGGTDYGFDETRGAFAGSSGLKNIMFEEGTTEIATNLFKDCDGLKSIIIPDSVTTIETDAFQNCSNLEEVTFSKNLTDIDSYAFNGCSSLKKAILPDSITSMGTYIFAGCTSLEEVKIPNQRVNITEGTFQACTALSTITLPDSVQYIRKNAFQNSGLTEIVMSKNLLEIEQNAFQNSDSLMSVIVPNSVSYIGPYAFYDCDQLQNVALPDSLSVLGSYSFQSCDELKEVTLGLGLTKILTYTFADCGKLQSIVIPYNVTTIENYAFKNCTSLTEITVPRKTTSISNNAFSYPGQMTLYGVAGTYGETYAGEQGMTFVDRSVAAESVQLPQSVYEVNRGSTITLLPTITPANFTDLITYKSTNTSVATVDENGKVKGVAVGTANIKITVGGVSTSCKITVKQPVTSISLNKTSLTMEALDTYNLTATPYPDTANDRSVQWTSSDEKVATVSQSGTVTALSKGTCTITASAMDGSGVTRKCNVTVTNNAHVAATVEELQSSHPYENNCSDVWQYCVPGVYALDITFSGQTSMEEDFDYLYLLDGNNNELGKYTGAALAGKTIRILGDTVRIRLQTDEASGEYGFKVEKVTVMKTAPSYTIVYNKNNSGATGTMSTQKAECDSTVQLKGNAFKRTGYTFTGWNTKSDGSGKTYANKASVKNLSTTAGATVALYAQWKKDTYQITYNGNGGTNNRSNPKTYTVTTNTITLKAPTRTGYAFGGWYSDKALTKKVTQITKGSTGNKTLYAKWTPNKYTIKFDKNGATSGSMSAMKNRKYGTSYTLSNNKFKRKGYTFTGWNTQKNGKGKTYKNKVSVKNLISTNGKTVTLYAQWKKVSYQITYKLNGGTNKSSNPKKYDVTTKTITLKAPTRKGYTFKGWYSDSKFKKKVTQIKKGNTGKITLYAKWAPNKYTIKFNGNGATSGKMKNLINRKYGTSYKLTANTYKKKGYKFVGWNTKKNGKGKSYKNKASVKNLISSNGKTVTLYAQWKKK